MTLGGPAAPSRPVGHAAAAAILTPAAPEMRKITISIWSNGFSIDDGEEPSTLFSFEKDQALLNSIMSSLQRQEIPPPFRKYGRDIEMALEDKRQEDFVPPKITVKSFSGHGNRLGAPVPGGSSEPSPSVAPPKPIVASATTTPAAAPTVW